MYWPRFFLKCYRSNFSIGDQTFFCGGKELVAEELKLNCEKKYHNNHIVGVYCPPFRPVTDEELKGLGDKINSKNVDIVCIGLRTPKQEYFAKRLSQYTNVHFIVTIGAAFDFHTNKIRKAPLFITKLSMEWFYRLSMEPVRLWRRYLEVVPKFIYYSIKELLTKTN